MCLIYDVHFFPYSLNISLKRGEATHPIQQDRDLLQRMGDALQKRIPISVENEELSTRKIYNASTLRELLSFSTEIALHAPHDTELQELLKRIEDEVAAFAPIEKLAFETLGLICSWLNINDLSSLAATCRLGRNAANYTILQKAKSYGHQRSDIHSAKKVIQLYEAEDTYSTPELKVAVQKMLKTPLSNLYELFSPPTLDLGPLHSS